MKDIQYKTIEALRFICAALVVLRHTAGFIDVSGNEYPVYKFVVALFSFGITEVCVPVFFMISGYLFFTKLHSWDWSVYRSKIKSRLTTLVVPYCVWNVVAVFASMGVVVASTGNIRQALSVFSDNGSLRIFWDCANISVSETWGG